MKKIIFFALCLNTFSSSLYAEDVDVDLNPIVVTGNRQEQRLSDVMTSVSVITREDIDRQKPQDLLEILQGEPGIETRRSGGIGLQSSIFMRGANSNQVLILVDGLNILDEFTAGPSLPNISISQIDHIEIIRGNASALYGSNAVGGIIQIFTKSRNDNYGPYGSASYGSRSSKNIIVGYKNKYNNTKFDISYNNQQTDGFRTFDANAKNVVFGQVPNPSNNPFSSNNVSLNISQFISKDHEFGLKILASEFKVKNDSGSNASRIFPFDASSSGLDLMQRENSKQLLMQAYSKDLITSYWNSKVAVGVTNTVNRFNYNDDNLSGVPIGVYNTHQTNVLWENNFILSNNQTMLIGLESRHSKLKGSDMYFGVPDADGSPAVDAQRTTNSTFASYTSKFNGIGLQLNVRHDATNTNLSSTTGLGGLSYDLTNHWKIAGNLSNAFGAPSLGQLFGGPGSGANPNLKPERDKSKELSLQYLDGNTLGRIVIFNRESKDLLSQTGPLFNGFNTWENINKAKNDGIEFSAKTIINSITFKMSATFQNSIDATTNVRLKRRAKEFGSFELSYPIKQFTLGSQMLVSGNARDTSFATSLDTFNSGYAVVNLFANYKYNENWSTNLRVENLFDRSYQVVNGFNTPDFGAFLTLQYIPFNSENPK
jgi:vitamin B12 transporter